MYVMINSKQLSRIYEALDSINKTLKGFIGDKYVELPDYEDRPFLIKPRSVTLIERYYKDEQTYIHTYGAGFIVNLPYDEVVKKLCVK